MLLQAEKSLVTPIKIESDAVGGMTGSSLAAGHCGWIVSFNTSQASG